MMAMVLMASNGIVVDGFVLTSNFHMNDATMIIEQNVSAAIGSDVCNYVDCNVVMAMEVDDGDDDVYHTTIWRRTIS